MPGIVIRQTIYVDSEEEKQDIILRIKRNSTKEEIEVIRKNLNIHPKIKIERYDEV